MKIEFADKGSEPNKVIVWSEISEAEVKEIVDYHK